MKNHRSRRLTRWLTLAGAAAFVSCFSERSSVTPPESGNNLCDSPPGPGVVVIRNFAFEPSQLQVSRGTRVTWVNCDSEAHTSTSDGPGWDSGLLSSRQTFSRVFDQAGQLPYHCEPHPFMRGTIIVE